ncbi:MAG TPA: SAM-dependent methyltransferase, partial [Lachnospiraceae bacterium]|nr:SAM-dependent methyltransferase [Lachnospiraceae bacterium]
ACDTATDFALAKAVGWKAKVILSVPCCQHELNAQIENELLAPILSYGLLKERMAALITDGLRAQYLEQEGYDTQILEFIDMEHTPKNILIRAVRTGKPGRKMEEIGRLTEALHVSPTLGKLLEDSGR